VYIGTDLSARAVRDLQGWLSTQPALAHVELRQRQANDFTGLPAKAFDTVLLNSVVQYLPDAHYLLEVLRGAVQSIGSRGCVFIGDVRHLALLPLFHTSVELARASTQTTMRQLRSRVRRALDHDNELALDPAIFQLLAAHLGISGVEVLLKRGCFDNELTHYRYDVVMRNEIVAGPSPETFDGASPDAFERFAAHLIRDRPRAILLRSIANRRLARDLAAWRLVQSSEEHLTVGELLAQLDQIEPVGIDPEALWALGDAQGYRVRVSWTDSRSDGAIDVEFIELSQVSYQRATALEPAELPSHWTSLASDPRRASFMQQLGARLRERLRHTLPEYMVPAHFTLLESLPLNCNGKLDRKALPEPDRAGAGEYEAPQGEMEEALAGIWSQVLGVERIGRHDNFFELGGDSILSLRVVAKARERSITLALQQLFEHQSLQALAAALTVERATAPGVSVAEMSRLLDELEAGANV
jgi:aryl carrier-like protein